MKSGRRETGAKRSVTAGRVWTVAWRNWCCVGWLWAAWVIFQPERREGRQHLGPARITGPEPRHLWACPQAQAHRECLGTSPTCPETLRPCSKAVMAGRGPLLGLGQLWRGGLCREQVPAGAVGRWACGFQSVLPPWLPWSSSACIHIRSLRSFPDTASLLTRRGSLTPCTGGSLNPLSTRHGAHGPLSPIMRGGSRHTWLPRHASREALRGRRSPRIPRLINGRVGL